ncbi:MAG: hypothetical protein V4672_03390 [Verrucomicrobiota bacterium]
MRTVLHFPPLRISAFMALALAANLQAEPRTFTSPDGRTLQADVQSATTDMVTLKLANGAPLTVQISKFSEADQTYIAEWRKANPTAIKYNFATSFTKDKRDSSKSSRNNEEITTDTWACNVKLANRSNQTLDGLKMDYEIYYTQVTGKQAVTRKMTGQADVPSIKHLEELVVPTRELKLTTSKLEGGYYYLDGSRSRQKDAIEGVAIKLTHDGKMVYEWASAGVPKDRGATAEGTSGSLAK